MDGEGARRIGSVGASEEARGLVVLVALRKTSVDSKVQLYCID